MLVCFLCKTSSRYGENKSKKEILEKYPQRNKSLIIYVKHLVGNVFRSLSSEHLVIRYVSSIQGASTSEHNSSLKIILKMYHEADLRH